jgi:hypothetical protein
MLITQFLIISDRVRIEAALANADSSRKNGEEKGSEERVSRKVRNSE